MGKRTRNFLLLTTLLLGSNFITSWDGENWKFKNEGLRTARGSIPGMTGLVVLAWRLSKDEDLEEV